MRTPRCPSVKLSCEDVRIAVSGDLAWVTCVEVITPFGGDSTSDSARMQATNLFGRVGDQWRLVHHHASPSPEADDEDDESVN